MSQILLFSEIKLINSEIIGVKALNIAMIYQKQKIPAGFVLTTLGHKYFLETTGVHTKITEILSKLNSINVQETANNIQKLIIETKFPQDLSSLIIENYLAIAAEKKLSAVELLKSKDEKISVAIRVSHNDKKENNTESLSLLNIKGENELLTAIKVIYASEFTSRNLSLKLKTNSSLDSKIAVIVQKMVYPEKSVQIFTNSTDYITLKAIFGAYEGFNDKEITPDEYYVGEKDFRLKKISVKKQQIKYEISNKTKSDKISIGEIGKMQKLSETEILESSKIASEIGKNKLVEIAICKEDFFVLSIKDIEATYETAPFEKNMQKLEVYEVSQKQDDASEEDEVIKDEIKIYDSLEAENESKQKPLKKKELKVELIHKEEIHPIREKIEDGAVNYDEEDDLREEFDREDIKVYENDYESDKKQKKTQLKPKLSRKKDEKEEEKTAYLTLDSEDEEISDEKEKLLHNEKEKTPDKKNIKEKNSDKIDKEKDEEKPKYDEDADDSIFSSLKTY